MSATLNTSEISQTITEQVEQICQQARQAALPLANTSPPKVNDALKALADLLDTSHGQLIAQNQLDVAQAQAAGQSAAFIDRLTLTPSRINAMSQGVRQIAGLHSRTGRILEEKTLPNGLLVQRVAVPLGVIGIIYESRPNVTVDAAALCLKSGNAVVLKGGSESINSNRLLVSLIKQALQQAGIAETSVGFIDSAERAATAHLLKQDKYLDVLIPRGGYQLVQAVVDNSRIPVLYHAEGGARIYVDASADLDMATDIIFNSKTSRPSTCNTLDTLVLHRNIAASTLEKIVPQLRTAGVEIRADCHARELVSPAILPELVAAEQSDWSIEFLDLILAVHVVDTLEQALNFISRYSKRHTEGIVAQDKQVIASFVNGLDAAALMVNCSTRLHDGGEFGLGAEMGIATGKLHARGPVGLDELSTYKWVAYGTGQVRS